MSRAQTDLKMLISVEQPSFRWGMIVTRDIALGQ